MIKHGIYPTMITPYKNGEIDYDGVEKLVNWYAANGCAGIFAVCQSSEMNYLSLQERTKLAKHVTDCAAGRLSVVVSGHCANSIDAQAEEIAEISRCGADAFVLVSNRLDLHNDGDDVWLQNAQSLLDKLDKDLTFGIYECPVPYKRLLTPKILDWCIHSGRFAFIKDTCCDPDQLTERLAQLRGSGIGLFNANTQTLLHSLQQGAAGFSGIMGNFQPDLLAWLYENYQRAPKTAQQLADYLSLASFTEGLAYPCTAKYYLGFEGIQLDTWSRSRDDKQLTAYHKHVMEQLHRQHNAMREYLKESKEAHHDQ